MKRATPLFEAIVLGTILLCSLSTANAQSEGPNGHYYRIVLEPNLHWEAARLKAAESTFNGLHGHLATITSYDEDKFIESLRVKSGSNAVLWVGGYRSLNNTGPSGSDGWVWVNGEGRIPAANGNDLYSNWLPSEPNSGSDSERFLAIGRDDQFGWSSESVEGKIGGYVIEYPGAGTATKVSVTTIDPIAIENPMVRIQADIATFEFRREGNLSLDLPVFYTVSGTALNGFDYDEISRSIVIPAGESSVRLNIVPRIDDAESESMETVGIRIEPSLILTPEAAYHINLRLREAGAVIYEQGAPEPGALQLAVPRGSTVYAEGEPVVLLAALSSPKEFPTVDFLAVTPAASTSLRSLGTNKIGSATAIYRTNELAFYRFAWTNPIPGEISIIAVATVGDIRLVSSPLRIIVQGPTESPVVRIRSVPLDATADVLPSSDFAAGYFEVSRTGSTAGNLQVHYSVGGSATAGVDYETLQKYVVIGAGRTSARIIVTVIDDHIPEPQESVTLSLISPTNVPPSYILDPTNREATVWIIDNDPISVPPVVSIVASRPETSEPAAGVVDEPGQFLFHRTGPTNESLRVFFGIEGTATMGLDYSALPSFIDFLPGQEGVRLNVSALADNLVELDETVILKLARAPDATVAARIPYTIDTNRWFAVVTIHDRTRPTNVVVSVEATRPETVEPRFGISNPAELIAPGEFTFRRNGSTNHSLNVYFVLAGTATMGLDYNGLSNRVEFPAGRSEVKANVFPFADNLVEGSETVVVELTHPPIDSTIGSYTIDPEGRRAVVTIHDRTPQPPTNIVVSVEATRPETSEPGILTDSAELIAPGEFTFRRSGGTNNSLDVFYVLGGTATVGLDYNGLSNRIEFPAGKSEVQAHVFPFADNLVEGDETVVVELSIPRDDPAVFPIIGGYTIDPDKRRAVVTIHDRTPTNLPIVTVEATRPNTWEPGRNDIASLPGEFTIRRRGRTNDPLAVYFVLDGSAKLAADYTTDTNVIEFRPGQSEAVRRVTPLADDLVENDETVVMRLLDRPEIYTVHNEGARATVTIHDRPDINLPPKVAIVRPADGATFLQGETVRVVVEAADRDGIAKLELLVDGVVSASVEGPRLEANLVDLALGGHVLLGRAMDNSNLVSTSAPVRILIRHRDTVCFVKRNLPETYAPGVRLTVELRATPPAGTHAYAVEDQPPVGWQVGEISHNGVFDPVSRKVKFGPYTDAEDRLLTYRLTPPADASGRHTFTGNSSVNGALYPICGDETIEPMRQFHPADLNQDFTINLSEVTAYAAAWKAGDTWPVGPNPIPLNYVTRAALIWRRGEHYIFDPSQGPAPACWVPSGGSGGGLMSALAAATAKRLVPDFQPGTAAQIQVLANPPGSAASYAVEEKPPRGWTVSNISHDGAFDVDTGVIRWGVFFDATPRTLSYTLTPPAGVGSLGDFSGEFSHDGSLVDILSASVVIEAPTPIQITGVAAGPDSVSLEITGPVGQTAVIESSSDFVSWTEVQSIFIPDGEIGFKTEPTARGALFYRLRVR